MELDANKKIRFYIERLVNEDKNAIIKDFGLLDSQSKLIMYYKLLYIIQVTYDRERKEKCIIYKYLFNTSNYLLEIFQSLLYPL